MTCLSFRVDKELSCFWEL